MATKKEPRRLLDFVMDQKRAACPVCKLSDEVKEQLQAAKTRKIPQSVQIQWLKDEMSLTVEVADFQRHYSQRHEAA